VGGKPDGSVVMPLDSGGHVPDEVLDAAARDRVRSDDDRARARSVLDAAVAPITTWWRDHDLLVTPATFRAGWALGSHPGPKDCGTLAAPFSLTGQPSLVVPVPGHRRIVGVQIVGRHGDDDLLLRLAGALQAQLDWTADTPPTFAG
jgi:Asp-tRNA(Asn)/Glu-tRNA(Gln) amidotransferase A subunit family amidase